ncbi:MAG: hypothetical protein MUC97_14880 [Bernardetiaceae bacterium]|jgi:hypothetical protein|nr:hypothetical protein [Bernardetiaceae bacterium]
MKKLLFLSCLLAQSAFAQSPKAPQSNFDFAIAAGNGLYVAPSWSRFHGLGAKGKFQLGYGLRLTSQFGSNVPHLTAPAKLTTGQNGPGVLFQETIEANLDTLTLQNVQVNSLNASIHLQYAFSPKLEVGFNIDAIGFSFGGQQSGRFEARSAGRAPSTEMASPTTFNLLLISDNDLGSVNSELYVRYWLSPRWALRGGLGFAFSEYTTSRTLTLDNDRFRAKRLMPMLAVSFAPWRGGQSN